MNRLMFLLLYFAIAAGCSDEGPPPQSDNKAADVGVDMALGRDQSADLSPSACTYQNDCNGTQICHNELCVPAPTCTDTGLWIACVEPLEALDRRFGIGAYCDGSYCRVACLDDSDCAPGETCTDYGVCKPFTGELTSEYPGGQARAPLKAGVSNVLMNFPIGVPPAGFGSLKGSVDSPYSDLLPPSVGQMHGLFARGLALDNGERELLIVRLPIVFPTATLHEDVARMLQARTSRDWRDSLVITGTHTHSGPGRHWHLPVDTALPVGTLGTGSYSQEIQNWLAESTFQAAVEALESKQTAKFGWQIVEAFDNDDLIASDRWGETPPFDDNRLLLIRVDDENDVPIAALMSFGMHSTLYQNGYLTSDAGGGVERGYEEAMAQEYGRFVPAFFLNENGGTMSPRGGRYGHDGVDKFEAIGEQFVSRTFDTFRNIPTKTDINIQAYTHRFAIGYDEIGYLPGEWSKTRTRTVDDTFWHGGLNCVPNADDDFATHSEPHDYFCLGVQIITKNRPVSIARRSMMTAIQLDDLTVLTVPGEPSMEVGYQMVKRMNDRYGVDWRKAFIWGYAQDHQLYITPTNLPQEKPFFPGIIEDPASYPEYAFSFLQGGYEPSLSMWGYKFGDFMVDKADEAIDGLLNGPKDRTLPLQLTPRAFEPVEITETDAARAGLVLQDMPAQVERLNPVEFSWVGGHPGAEAPQAPLVSLERQNGADWEPVQTSRLRPYDNTEPTMLTRVRAVANGEYEWVVYWEELFDFPLGRYRFRVNGGYQNDGQHKSYVFYTAEFEIVPTDELQIDSVQIASGTVTGWIGYSPAALLEKVGADEDPGAVRGNYRMRHPRVATELPAPAMVGPSGVTVRILNAGGTTVSTFSAVDAINSVTRSIGGRMIPGTQFQIAVGAVPQGGSIQVDVVDQYGNSGSYP